MRGTRILMILAVALLATAPVFAQTETTTGSINGVVTDNTGGALPGVTVTVTNTQTGLSRNTVTENDGTFTVPQLPPGTYRVGGELSGLGNAQRTGISVLLGTSTKVDLRIAPQVAETITVTADSPVVDVTETASGEAVTQAEIDNLPILGRDFKDLILLTPGVTTAFGGRVSLVGARGTAVDFNIDGANANSDFFAEERGGTAAPYVFSQAAIREFQVIRNTYSAEYSRGGGGTMNAITKSGTNDITGEAFYYQRNADWADKRTILGIEESFEARDAAQYGLAIGGPFVRDQLFWFANADIQKIEEEFSTTDFRTSARFQGLDPALQASVIARLEQLTGHPLDQEFNYDTRENQDTYLLKFDWNIGSSNHANFRWNFSDFNNFPSESTGTLSAQGEEFNTVNSYVGQVDSVLTNNLYNFALGQYSLEERPINPLTTSFPKVNITGLLQSGSIAFGQQDFLPNGTDEEKWEIKDTLTWIRGNHQLKTGFNYLTVDVANLFVRDLAGDFTFTSPQNFLAGTPSRFEQGAGPVAVTAFDFDQYGVFLMDTWRPIPQLSLDFGVRYDFMTMPTPLNNAYASTNPELVDNFQEDGDNIAPRFGFAYDFGGRGDSVIRGGIGKYYTPIPGILLAQPLQQTAGLFQNYTFVCSATVQCPTFPNIFTEQQLAGFNATALLDLTTIDPDFEAGESVRGSLGYQQRLFQDYSFEVEGILGEHSKQQRLVNVNAVPTGLTFGDLNYYTVAPSNRPYPAFANVRMHVSDAEGEYKSATVSLRKLGLAGSKLSWLAHYTWSESIDEDTNSRSTSSSFSYDPYDSSISRGPSDNDVTHRVVASATYELPWGFLASGIFNWRTGQPYTRNIFYSGGPGSLTGIARMPNVPVFVDGDGNVIDITAATGSTPAQFAEFINSRNGRIIGRNTENQPDFMNIDLRVAKRFGLPMGTNIELIAEVFNLLNESNKFITTNNQNEFQITQGGTSSAPIFNITRNANFRVENGLDFNSPPRQYQAAVKFNF
jgi:hypothetical protein